MAAAGVLVVLGVTGQVLLEPVFAKVVAGGPATVEVLM